MSNFKQRALQYIDVEWATYVKRYYRWPAKVGLKRVNAQGYLQFRDMAAHVLGWWEEGVPIVLAIAEGREYDRKKYDFAVFNAASVAKYKVWNENIFFSHFEKTRQKLAADLRSMNNEAWENPRVQKWIDGIFISHAREHAVASSRFLVLDTLQNEWNTYAADFEKIEDKDAFLSKQGVGSFRELLGHMIGWWEEGQRVINGFLEDPGFVLEESDMDAFNAELIEKYKALSDEEVLSLFEAKRQDMITLVNKLPEDAFSNSDIESWLAADITGHLDEHAVKP